MANQRQTGDRAEACGDAVPLLDPSGDQERQNARDELAVYVHIPWCIKKCPYCDFNSHPVRGNEDYTAYATALLDDWRTQLVRFGLRPKITSVFFGGGTPSLAPPFLFARILDALAPSAAVEVTMEANPGTAEYADFAGYRQAGINRLSIGVQSLNNKHLNALGRVHDSAEVIYAYDKARNAGFDNINLDLMWGLPAQAPDEALDDLQHAISLAPEHLSWYQLTIEEKTEFARRPPQLPQEDPLGDMETAGLALLEDSGYERYEVSAFAREQRLRCAHNLNYWGFGDYIGLGAGAHGKLTARGTHGLAIQRTHHPRSPRLFQAHPEAAQVDNIDPDDVPLEFLLNVLRLVEGVTFEEMWLRTGLGPAALAPHWARLVDLGLVHADRVGTTPLGLRYLDSTLAQFA
ncbi:MAG: radical SAM family heme chaperone HemW [Pseudomonadota bacterium]